MASIDEHRDGSKACKKFDCMHIDQSKAKKLLGNLLDICFFVFFLSPLFELISIIPTSTRQR